MLTGKPGCGKTTALAQIDIGNKNRYKDIIVIRGSEDCQWTYLMNAGVKMILWLRRGLKMEVFDRNTGKDVDLNKVFEKVNYYDSANDLIDHLSRNFMNVVETTPYTPTNPKQHLQFCVEWLEIMLALNQRRWPESVSVYFDEFEDLVPEGAGKKIYDIELSLSSILRKNRKNDISSFVTCHSIEDIHWRIRKKIRWFLYMRGARQTKDSKITKNLADLPVGVAIIEGDKFERFDFEPLGNERKFRARMGFNEI